MKRKICTLAFALSLLTITLKAQRAFDYLNQNGINARFNADGQLFWDGKKSAFEVPKGSGMHTLSAAALWIGGIDKNSQLHLSAQTYKQSGTDFWPGPLDTTANIDSATSSLYNKVWKVSRLEIDSFLAGLSIPKSILNWPGNGNTTKGFSSKLAPYIDVDNNGIYEPAKGDYPDIKGDVMLWWVFNDNVLHTQSGGQALKAEIQASAYTYNCTNDPILNNTIFLHYNIINRSGGNYNSLYVGLWTDFDIGNPFNDYVGCDTLHNSYFAYNSDSLDKDTVIIRGKDTISYKGFGKNLPTQSVTFLDGFKDNKGKPMPMSHFMYFNNTDSTTPMGYPGNASQYYYFLEGKWLNGSNLSVGGTGYGGTIKSNYAFPGDPTNMSEWTERSAKNKANDLSGIGSFGPVQMSSGASQQFTAAFTFNRSYSGQTMKSIALMQDNINNEETLYKKSAFTPCTGLSVCNASDTCVWPGDANNNKTADMYDVFNMGYAFGEKGPKRAFASSSYIAQHAISWGRSFPNGTDYCFADANGDGVIDSSDVLPIVLNYGISHPKKESTSSTNSTDPPLYVDIIEDSVPIGGIIHVRVKLGDGLINASGVTGTAFELDYDPTLIDSDGFKVDFSGSWLRTKPGSVVGVVHNDHKAGRTHSGQSTKGKTGITDSGIVIMYKYVVSDNISGGVKRKIDFGISNQSVIDANFKNIAVRTFGDSVFIYTPTTGIEEAIAIDRSVQLFPNPANEVINIEIRNISPQLIKVFNIMGQEIQTIKHVTQNYKSGEVMQINTASLSEGIYFIQLQGYGSTTMKKFSIAR